MCYPITEKVIKDFMANNKSRGNFPPSAYIALVGKKLLTAFRNGHRPTKDISLAQLKELAHYFNDAAAERRSLLESQNLIYNGGIQHTTITFDRAQLAYVVACMEEFKEPHSCVGLLRKLTIVRDSLIGDVEEEESAPFLHENSVYKLIKEE